MNCPYCNSTEVRDCPDATFWTGEKTYSCDNCDGRTFTDDDIKEYSDTITPEKLDILNVKKE